MNAKLMYCETCNREVRVLYTPAPTHEGHANIPDGPELVCLECGGLCLDKQCPITNMSHTVMEQRLTQLEQ